MGQSMRERGIPTLTEKGVRRSNNSTTIIKRNYIIEPETPPYQEILDFANSAQSSNKLNNKLASIKKEDIAPPQKNMDQESPTIKTEKEARISNPTKIKSTPMRSSKAVNKVESTQKPGDENNKTMRTKTNANIKSSVYISSIRTKSGLSTRRP